MRKPGEPARVVPPSHVPDKIIGVVAPASSFDEAKLVKACRVLNKSGHRTLYLDSIHEKELYFAGSVKRRVRELEDMFLRPEVDVILCARGGYGTNHLLPRLDMEVVRGNPKMFVGYSDITTLLTYFCDQADMVTYHGPMAVTDYANIPFTRFNKEMRKLSGFTNRVDTLQYRLRKGRQPRPGRAQGVLYGGCLSMLAASLGTPYEIHTENTVLFIEDVNTKPYQVDRMLMQLKLAGKFRAVRGFVFGEMAGCVQPGVKDYSVQDAILNVLGDLKVPIGLGLPSGHVERAMNVTLPIGAAAQLTVDDTTVTLEAI